MARISLDLKSGHGLLVFALKEECPLGIKHVLFTGVGLVQSTLKLTQYLSLSSVKPHWILNLGTAGSSSHEIGSLVEVEGFFQRDVDFTLLGHRPHLWPWQKGPQINPHKATQRPQALLGSGDSLEDLARAHRPYSLVDMEGAALFMVASHFEIPFISIKYVSDASGENLLQDWKASLPKARQSFEKFLREETLIFGPD